MKFNATYCRREVLAFAMLMERELRENDHKSGWKNCPAWKLVRGVRGEAMELRDVVRDYQLGTLAEDLDQVVEEEGITVRELVASEAADVANMAMMVADVCGAFGSPVKTKMRSRSRKWQAA